MFKRILKNKRGSQIVEILIAIAIIGTLAITALGNISTRLQGSTTQILDTVQTGIDNATGP